MTNLKLVINNSFQKKQKFFVKQELKMILNLYAQKVSSGDWKDYSLYISKKEVSFDVYQRTSDQPVFRILKNLKPLISIGKMTKKPVLIYPRKHSMHLNKKINTSRKKITNVIKFIYDSV